MRVFVAIVFFVAASPAVAGGHSHSQFGWGAGAFNSNYRPAGSSPVHTPSWQSPSWRGGYLSYPGTRVVAPYAYTPYTYYPSYYPPYGSTYYGFQPTQQQQEAEPPPLPQSPQVIVFEHQDPPPVPQAAVEPAPAPQVIVVQLPAPVAPAPAPAVVAAPVEPPKPAGPPREVYKWTDSDGVVHYSTLVPAGVKADKVGPK